MDKRKRKLLRGLFGFIGISLLFLILQETSLFKSLEETSLDLRYRFFNNRTKFSDDVVIIDIDDESIKNLAPAYGRWPWPRRVYKDIIEFINSGQPSAIIFDFLFTEEQKNTNDDAQLAEISKLSPNVSHAMFLLKETSIEGQDFIPLTDKTKTLFKLKWQQQDTATAGTTNGSTNNANNTTITSKTTSVTNTTDKFKDYLLPNPLLFQNTNLIHVVNVEPDKDGQLRRIPLLIPYGSDYLPSLALRGLLSKTQDAHVTLADRKILIFDNNKLKWQIPLDENMYLPLHYYSAKTFPQTFRVAEVLDGQKKILEGSTDFSLNPELFKDKIVIIGTSAVGLSDLKVTPIGLQFPGVFLHATGIANVLKNEYLLKPDPLVVLLCPLLIILLIELFIFSFDSFIIRTVIPPIILLAYPIASLLCFQLYSFYLPIAHSLLFGLLALLDGYIYIALIEGKARRKMENTLSKYLSPNVTKDLITSGVDPTAEVGSSKELTVLFSDIRGFTTLSEKMEPAALVHLLNDYLAKMTDVVFDHDGTLDKFIGDAIMAFWGAPLEDINHSSNAVKTGLHMLRELEKLNQKWRTEGIPQLKVGIGILSGKVIVGNIGGAKRLDYTVIGDNVNTASRLEGLTKKYDCRIIIAESTYIKIQHDFVIRTLDLVVVKGKTQALKIFEPLVEKGHGTNLSKYENLANKFNTAWELYYNGNFSEALGVFEQTEHEFPDDGPTKVYIERCRDLILSPPNEWTGVFIATSK